VVVAGRAGLGFRRWLLEADTEGLRTTAESRRDTRSQPIARGTANNQHPFGAITDGALGFGIGNLLAHIGGTTLRVRVDTDESTYFRFDNHVASCHREYAKAAIIMVRRAENSSDWTDPAPDVRRACHSALTTGLPAGIVPRLKFGAGHDFAGIQNWIRRDPITLLLHCSHYAAQHQGAPVG